MPRRRKITIRASELECFETLVRELQQRPEFAGFDPSSLHVWAYERYEPKLKDADAILRRFDYWLGVHKGERYLMANGSRLFNKKELAEALGVARPTLDRWITNGWLAGKAFGEEELQDAIKRGAIQILDDATIEAMKAKRARDKARDEAEKQKDAIASGEQTDWQEAMKQWNEWENSKEK